MLSHCALKWLSVNLCMPTTQHEWQHENLYAWFALSWRLSLPVSQKDSELGKPWRKATFRFSSVAHWWEQGLTFVPRVSRAHGYLPPLSSEKARVWNVSTDGSNHSAHSQISITETTWRYKCTQTGKEVKKTSCRVLRPKTSSISQNYNCQPVHPGFTSLYFRFVVK